MNRYIDDDKADRAIKDYWKAQLDNVTAKNMDFNEHSKKCTELLNYNYDILKALRDIEPAKVIHVDDIRSHIREMYSRDIRSALIMDGYRQALCEMLGWIAGYGEENKDDRDS